ncbi:hypothetical protein ABIT13_16645 [Limnospira fusiformis NRMCF6962]
MLYALDANTGNERWRFRTENWIVVGVERKVTFPNSHSKPCLILSHHTAPDVDTLFCQ